MEGYSQVILERRDINANIVQKSDTNLRLDAMVEVSSRQLNDVLQASDRYDKWFTGSEWHCTCNMRLDKDVYLMTLQQGAGNKGDKYDFVYRKISQGDALRHDYQMVMSGEGLLNVKFKQAVNKRLLVETWAFHLSQMGVQEEGTESGHSKVFCFVQAKKE